jgi:CTP:molybdopterin cytidylyltransferase MocA
MPTHVIGCVILAAGAGTRFGEPKAGALLQSGVRFVDRIVAACRSAGIEYIVAVLHPDVKAPESIRVVRNSNPASEQIASLRLGLAQLVNTPVRGALVWPVDHPLVSDESIATIVSSVLKQPPLIARPVHQGGHGHPVYFSRDLWRELVTVEQGGAREIVHKYASDITEIDVPDPGVLRNVDTIADLAPPEAQI